MALAHFYIWREFQIWDVSFLFYKMKIAFSFDYEKIMLILKCNSNNTEKVMKKAKRTTMSIYHSEIIFNILVNIHLAISSCIYISIKSMDVYNFKNYK